MNLSKKTIVAVILLSLVLFVTGFIIWSSLFVLILPIVHGTNYLETDMTTPFRNSLVFGVTLALIPVATILVWKFAPVFKPGRKVFTAVIIVVAMMVSVVIRREVIKSQLRNLKPITIIDFSSDRPVEKSITQGLTVNDLEFEYFALVGVVAGSAISLFVLKEKTNKKTTF